MRIYHIYIANDVSTTPIAANDSKVFGFKASKEPDINAEITDCTVSSVTIGENFETLKDLETGLIFTAYAHYDSKRSGTVCKGLRYFAEKRIQKFTQ